MGKRIIIKGADFSQVAVSNEPILNPLEIIGSGYNDWINPEGSPDGSYWFLSNNGNLYEMINGAGEVVSMPEGYDSLVIGDVVLNKPSGATRYDVAYPDNLEPISLISGKRYMYDAEQSTEPQMSDSSSMSCAHISLKTGDVLIYNGNGGDGARGIWVMKSDYSLTIKVSSSGIEATYSPFIYVADEDCEIFINSSTSLTNYVYRK